MNVVLDLIRRFPDFVNGTEIGPREPKAVVVVPVSYTHLFDDGLPRAQSTAAKPRRQHHAGVLGSGSANVVVPMQGTIVKVNVEVGQQVEAGDTVVILEAMKMENSVNAEKSGVVVSINVTAGDSVGAGDTVVVVE